KVEYHLDGAKQTEDTTAPYRWIWDTTAAADGAHKLKAIAYDSAGNSAPHEIDVTISNQGQDKSPPTVGISSPSNGATVNGQVTITADATDNKAVASVEFFVDGTSVVKDTTAPYSAPWDTTQASQGAHALKATATDTSANTADSTVTVTVDNAAKDTLPPVVAILSPADGATVTGTVTVSADVTDNVKVKDAVLLVDGSAVGSPKTSAPWEWPVDTTAYANGDHSIEVKASDDAANVGSKKIVAKFSNVVQDAPPTVSLMEPSDGATVSGTVKVHAMANDDRGLQHVEFKLDGKVMLRDSTSPYEWMFDTTAVANGAHEIVAEAKDSAGQVTSDKITVTVSNAGNGGGSSTGTTDIFQSPLFLGLMFGIVAAVAIGAGVALALRSKKKRQQEQQAMLTGGQTGWK
ncbi:MAG TPA: Ig-like domain-containing protein, partial [Thermoplasmata archaeon]|nr:Ig-like domain-containing protein [Thermoplasmata archaeon]